MSKWVPTPDDERLKAELPDGRIVEYTELKVGDVFRAITPDGEYVHPIEYTDTRGEVYALVTSAPGKNDMLGTYGAIGGYHVEVITGSLAELKKSSQ